MSICSNCLALCCRLFNTYAMTGADLLRLKNVLQLPYHFFTKLILIPRDEINIIAENNILFSFNQEGVDIDDRYIFSLKTQESLLVPNSKKCIFLQEWKSSNAADHYIVARCGIYDIRPYVCRAFPSVLDKNNCKGVIIPSINDLPEFDFCLSKYTSGDFADIDKQVGNLALWDFEKRFFQKVADKWNENPGKVEEVYEFIEKEYSNRIVSMQKSE